MRNIYFFYECLEEKYIKNIYTAPKLKHNTTKQNKTNNKYIFI